MKTQLAEPASKESQNIRPILICTALPVEYNAVRRLLTNLRQERFRQTVYECGEYVSGNRKWDVALCQTGAGNAAAAIETERAITHFDPRIVFFVGVAGGVKDVHIGDVVVASKVYSYEYGRADDQFKTRPDLEKSSYRLLQEAQLLARDDDWRRFLTSTPANTTPKIVVGPIAAGDKVVTSTASSVYDFIRGHYNDALAVEMEGYGFLEAIYRNSQVEAIVIRGISDLIDKKSEADAKGSQEIASTNATLVAYEILSRLDSGRSVEPPGGDLIVPPPIPTKPDPKGVLEELGRACRASIIALWQAMGVSSTEAEKLFDSGSVGGPSVELLKQTERPVLIIEGGPGSGKTMLALRLFQHRISDTLSDPNAPIPVYSQARSVVGGLQDAVEAECVTIGNPRERGATVIIDGADEIGVGRAEELLHEARTLARKWPKTNVVITTRRIPSLEEKNPDVFRIPPLSDSDSLALVSQFASQPVTGWIAASWPKSLQDAIHYPLFAVLLGRYLAERDMMSPDSTGDLLAWVVEQALNKVGKLHSTVNELLQTFAVLCLESGRHVLPVSEIGSPADLEALVSSGLVIQHSKTVHMAHVLFVEWFAARSLATGRKKSSEIVEDSTRLERWRNAIIIACATSKQEHVKNLLAPIAERNPAFASEIVNEGVAQWGIASEVLSPPALECGHQIREAMQSWIKGIGELAPLIAPLRRDGKLLSIGARTKETWLTTAWYNGIQPIDDVVELSASAKYPNQDWPSVRSARPGRQPGWAWKWSLEELASNLSKWTETQELPVEGTLNYERLWKMVLDVIGKSSISASPILVSEIEARLAQLGASDFLTTSGGRYDLRYLRGEIERLRVAGTSEVKPPWPVGNGPYLSWGDFRDDQLLARTNAVYEGALDGYQRLVERWFPCFASRLQTMVTLPARLVGIVTPRRQGSSPAGWPTISWYFEPLPRGSKTTIYLQLGVKDWDSKHLEFIYDRLCTLRPEASHWIGATIHGEILDIFNVNPATKLAYSWLREDLKRIKWLKP